MSNLVNLLPPKWEFLSNAKLLKSIEEKIDWEQTIFPPREQIFNALNQVPPEAVKVIILGQDPYHGLHQAMGLSFSVPSTEKIPPSLRNIFKEIESSTGKACLSGDLTHWAKQGVLLLNSILTVVESKPESHKKTGWLDFTQDLIAQLSIQHSNLVFMLWGAYAQKQEDRLSKNQGHLFLKAPHPSPLSAHRGFLGCNHFNLANEHLKKNNKSPIDWRTLM